MHICVCVCVWTYVKPVCVVFVSSPSGIDFIPSAGAITDYSQSAKNKDPYFKSYFKCGGPRIPKADTPFTERV